MILAADKITEIQQLTPPHFIIQHQKLEVARQTHTVKGPPHPAPLLHGAEEREVKDEGGRRGAPPSLN
jgi:hypothetical protein